MVWAPPKNGRQLFAEDDLTMDNGQQEEKRKTVTIMKSSSDGLHENQKHGRRYGRRQTYLAFENGQTTLTVRYIDHNKKIYCINVFNEKIM